MASMADVRGAAAAGDDGSAGLRPRPRRPRASPPRRPLGLLLLVACCCGGLAEAQTGAAAPQQQQRQHIWLTGIQPFTGGAWDGGISMRAGAEIMLEEINGLSTLLPGYELRIAWQDGLCDARVGHELFLENIFDQQYQVFAPGVSIGDLDSDQDGVITTGETRLMSEAWNATRVSPGPVGLLGPGCSSSSFRVAPVAFKARFPMISNSATRPGLSDRAAYPNFFRTIIPDTQFNAAWLSMVELLGQRSVVAVIAETENWASMGTALALEAAARNIRLRGFDMRGVIDGFSGLQISYDSGTAARDVAVELIRLKERIVILLMFELRNRLLLCENYKAGFLNAIYMPFGWLKQDWWMEGDTECSPKQISDMAMGFISAQALLWRSDADAVLSCSANMTAGRLKQLWLDSHRTAAGDTLKSVALANEVASTADAVCMYAQALHEVLLRRGVPLAELSARTPVAYGEIQEALSRADFEGAQGRVTFTPGMAEPSGTILLQQLQSQDRLVDIATYRQPTLTVHSAQVSMRLSGESGCAQVSTSKIAELASCVAPYTQCLDGELLDFRTNTCQECPLGTELYSYGPDGLACRPCGPGTYAGEGYAACLPCPVGTYAPREEHSMCFTCPADQYADHTGATACTPCPPGTLSNRDGNLCSFDPYYYVSLCSICFFVALSALTVFASCGYNARIVDVSQTNGKLIATTLTEHNIAHNWRFAPTTWVTISGTGVRKLDAPGRCFRARRQHPLSLELLTPEGQPISEEWCSSMGQVHQPFPMALVDSMHMPPMIPSPVGIVMGLLSAATSFLVFRPGAPISAAAAGLGVCLAAAACLLRGREQWRRTPIEKMNADFRARIRETAPSIQRTPRGPMRAITASQLQELFDFYSTDFIKQRTMHYVHSNIVIPLTAEERVSYAEFVGPHRVEWFVSHCWFTKFAEFVESLTRHSQEVPSQADLENCYWICTFSNNQWAIDEELGTDVKDSSFSLALRSDSCKGTAMVIDETALPLSRVWCLFEIMTTYERSKSDPSFAGVSLCSHSGVLNKGSASMDVAIKIASAVMTIDLRNAGASKQADKDAIFGLVQSVDGGFQAVNGFVQVALQESLLEVHEVFNKRFDDFMKAMQGQASMLHRLATGSSTCLPDQADSAPGGPHNPDSDGLRSDGANRLSMWEEVVVKVDV